MYIAELGADIEVLDRRPNKIDTYPAFLKVRDTHRATKASQRTGGIMHFHVRAKKTRAQDRDPIMLIGAGDIPAPLLLTVAAAGEDTVRIDLWIPAFGVVERCKAGTRNVARAAN
jgi:hypothetical protein